MSPRPEHSPTRLLAIETSGARCCVALERSGERFERIDDEPRAHARRCLPIVDELLAAAGMALADLEGIVVGAGPGSFTGLRIGIAVAQGLASAAALPVLCVSSLAAAARAAGRGLDRTTVVVAVDARMEELYGAVYQVGGAQPAAIALLDDRVARASNLADDVAAALAGRAERDPVLLQGDGGELLMAASDLSGLTPTTAQLDASALLDLAPHAPAEDWVDAARAEPVYLRDESRWTRAT